MVNWNFPCRHSALRVAYIDETNDESGGKVYYSVLVKGGEKYDQVLTKNSCLDSKLIGSRYTSVETNTNTSTTAN